MNTFRHIQIVLVLAFFVACSKDDSVTIDKPIVSISSTDYDTSFYMAGETEVPTVDWGGNQGSFSLGSVINELNVDAMTGVISWSNQLELGVLNVVLIATNSAGSTMTNITIENTFAGEFSGAYNNDPNSTTVDNEIRMGFDSSNEMDTADGGVGGTLSTSGVWSRNGSTITSVFSYDNDATFITMVTDITQNSTEGYLTGLWYNGSDASGTPSGYVRVDLLSTIP